MKAFFGPSLLIFTFLANCAHQGDDDFPVRRQTPVSSAEGSSPAVPPPPLAEPYPTPAVPMLPAPVPANRGAPAKPSLPLSSQPPSSKPGTKAVPGVLHIDEPLTAPVRRMINQAEDSLKKGKIMEARAQADRAYRMDLRDPRTSFLMARVSEREKAYEDAEQWAFRSLENLSDPNNQRVVWSFIARCREKNGNKKGAQAAQKQLNQIK